MKVGDVIKRCRKIEKLTLEKLGLKIGLTGKNANVRIAQYESNRSAPSGNIKAKLANALEISEHAISRPSLDTDIEVLHLLFKIDSMYGLYIGKYQDRVFLFFEPENQTLKNGLKQWGEKQVALRYNKITSEEYDLWKYSYEEPADGDEVTNA